MAKEIRMKHVAEDQKPIGVFDSGIGGLSVASHLMDRLPDENILYFGDSARVPYGSKSDETVRLYTRQAIAMLQRRGVKLIAIACNSASAVGLDEAIRIARVPVIGVINPGAREAVKSTRNGRIGIIGTAATVRSGAYGRAIRLIDPEIFVASRPCPLLVGFAEEGLTEHEATRLIVRDYLEPLMEQEVDTIVLGCTHYPILRGMIAEVAGSSITLVDPGAATADEIAETLVKCSIENNGAIRSQHRFVLSDLPDRFIEVGEKFLGSPIEVVEKIPLEDLTGSDESY